MAPGELVENYLKYGNENKKPGFRTTDELANLGSNIMEKFQKSMSKSSLLQSSEPDTVKTIQNKDANPMDKLFNSAAKLADSFIDAMSRAGKNTNEPSESVKTNNPINKYWEKASDLADQMADSKYPEKVSGSADQIINNKNWQKMLDLVGQMADSSKDKVKELASNQRDNPLMNGAAEMTEKDARFGTYPNEYYYGNQQMFHPYPPDFGGTYNQNQPGYAGPIFDSATNLGHNINGFNNFGGYYKNSNPSEIVSNPMAQYPAMYPGLSRTHRQMPPPYGRPNPIGGYVRTVLGGKSPLPPPPSSFGKPPSPPFGILPPPPPSHLGPVPIGGPGSFGGRHFPPHGGPLIKRSGSPGNIWDSATGLADSITNIATNPGKINTGQILGSTGTIFNAAKDLAGNIGNVGTNPSSIANQNPMGIENISSDKLLGSSKQVGSLLNPSNPIGSILNSATNLGSKITNIALNPANVANSQLLGSAGPLGSVSNQAVDMAGKIVNTALNPGINGNGQLLQSLNPTYAGGFFPRNNPSGSIVNSATQLASQILNAAATNSGNIGKIPLLKSVPGIGNYGGALPLGSIFNSATKLAGDITNIATVPGKLLVR